MSIFHKIFYFKSFRCSSQRYIFPFEFFSLFGVPLQSSHENIGKRTMKTFNWKKKSHAYIILEWQYEILAPSFEYGTGIFKEDSTHDVTLNIFPCRYLPTRNCLCKSLFFWFENDIQLWIWRLFYCILKDC